MSRSRWVAHLGCLATIACVAISFGRAWAEPTPQEPAPPESATRRVVSLDYCADQYVLGLVDRAEIAALSPDADAAFSAMRASAKGLAQVRPQAEDVLALAPDLVVRSYGGGPSAARFFASAGVPVVQIGFADDLEGVRAMIRRAGADLGAPDRADALIAEMDARLAALVEAPTPEPATPPVALYVTPGGVTSGPGSLVDALMSEAGLRNYQTRPGWRTLPLEALARRAPDLAVTAGFAGAGGVDDPWSSARHPVVRASLREAEIAPIEGAWTACGGWYLAEAVEALVAARWRHAGATQP